MIFFLRRGDHSLTCETRLNETGPGYELAITEDGKTRTEPFVGLAEMLAREHELLQAWRAQGWREIGPAAKKE